MRKLIILFSIMFLIMPITIGHSQESSNEEVPPWMEKTDPTGRSNYMIPKGAKKTKIGSQVVVEAPNEFMARRFYEIDNHLAIIDDNQKKFDKEIKELKRTLESLEKKMKFIEEQQKKQEEEKLNQEGDL